MAKEIEYASPETVRKQAKQWDDAIVACRAYGHIWDPLSATHNKKLHFYSAAQICRRCETERHMEVSEKGTIFATWYVYIDGYLSLGLGRIAGASKDVIRLAAITRTFPMTNLTGVKADEDVPRSARARKALGNGDA